MMNSDTFPKDDPDVQMIEPGSFASSQQAPTWQTASLMNQHEQRRVAPLARHESGFPNRHDDFRLNPCSPNLLSALGVLRCG